jgi:hypothetical protein
MYPGPKVQDSYNEDGIPTDKEATEKRAKIFIEELLWCIRQINESSNNGSLQLNSIKA